MKVKDALEMYGVKDMVILSKENAFTTIKNDNDPVLDREVSYVFPLTATTMGVVIK